MTRSARHIREKAFDETSREYVEPVWLTHQEAYSIIVRLAGSAADRHTVMVACSRYDRKGRAMLLQKVTIAHVRQLPSGGLKDLAELVQQLSDFAKTKTPAMDVEVHVDVTRSPVAFDGLPGDPSLYMLATTGLDRSAPPYRYIGRLLLLSSMQIALRSSRLVIALPAGHDDPRIVTAGRLEQALSNVEIKTPKAESEELLLDQTGPDDDLALCTGLALFLSDERLISPEDLRFRKLAAENRNKWVV